MIKSKEDFLYYLEQDKLALGEIHRKYPRMFTDEIWRFQQLLRKREYLNNCKHGIVYRIYLRYLSFKAHRLALKCGGYSIPLNIFESGLSIAHYGAVVVSAGAKVGKNCRIHEGTCIGATNGSNGAAFIGDNVFIGTGAKIIGNIKIENNVSIGAGAVVVKSITEAGTTWGGVPASKISSNDSHLNLSSALFDNQ